MNILNQIRIGSVNYDVILSNETLVCNGIESKGLIDFDNTLIKVNDDIQSRQSTELTLLHEIVHGITHDRGLEFGENDEKIVDELAKGLHQLIKDNKDLFK